jgi:hypothetical protein
MSLQRLMAINLTPVLFLNIVAILIVLGTAFLLVLQNGSSRNLALALGALVAATVVFGIQLYFELQPSTTQDTLSTVLTIDREIPEIRQWSHDANYTARIDIEAQASSWLAQNNPKAFSEFRLAQDFLLFSFLAFLLTEEYDWQLRKKMYTASPMPHARLWVGKGSSKRGACTFFSMADLRSLLARSGNLFADAPSTFIREDQTICMPPASTIEISYHSLIIRHPICEVSFNIEAFYSDSSARSETMMIGLSVNTTYFALRAQHRDSSKYREWSSQLGSGAHKWFEP